MLGATSVNATTGKVTVSAPPAVLEGEEMQNLPMYFPKTALSPSSDVISGIQFKFLGGACPHSHLCDEYDLRFYAGGLYLWPFALLGV